MSFEGAFGAEVLLSDINVDPSEQYR